MNQTLEQRGIELAKLDVTKMNSEDVSSAKSLIHYMFLPLLPYKSKSGVMFRSNGVSLTSSYGIVFGDNYGQCKGTYSLMLFHRLLAGDGSIGYDTSIKIPSISHEALDLLGEAIQANRKRIAQKMLDSIN